MAPLNLGPEFDTDSESQYLSGKILEFSFRTKLAFLSLWLVTVAAVVVAMFHVDQWTNVEQRSVAVLEDQEGPILARSEGVISWRDLIKGQGISDGDIVATTERSHARIRFDKNRTLLVGEDSQIQVTEVSSKRGSDFIIRLIRGSAVPQVSDHCTDCPLLYLRAGDETFTISAGKKIAVVKAQGSQSVQTFKPRVIPVSADFKTVVAAMKPALSAVAPSYRPPPAPEPELAALFLKPLPPAPPVAAPPPSPAREGPADGNKVDQHFEALQVSEQGGTGGKTKDSDQAAPGGQTPSSREDPISLEGLSFKKLPAPLPPQPLPALTAVKIPPSKLALTDSLDDARSMKPEGSGISSTPIAPPGSQNKEVLQRAKLPADVKLSAKSAPTKRASTSPLANSQPASPEPRSPTVNPPNPKAEQVAQVKVLPTKVITPLAPPPPLAAIRVDVTPPPRGVEYWTMRSLDAHQEAFLELPVPTWANDKLDPTVTLKPFFLLTGSGQTEEIPVNGASDPVVRVPLRTIKRVSAVEATGGVRRYHFKARPGIESTRGSNQKSKSLADSELNLTVVTLGEVPEGPINIGVGEFSPRAENPNSIWIEPKGEIELRDAGLMIQLFGTNDYTRFLNLVRGAKRFTLDLRYPFANEGYFVVREDQIVAAISGPLLDRQIISRIMSVLNADLVFKGQRSAFQNIRDFAQNKSGNPLWSLINKGHVLYILKKGTLYPVSREFLKSNAEVQSFIGNQAQALFVKKVEIISQK